MLTKDDILALPGNIPVPNDRFIAMMTHGSLYLTDGQVGIDGNINADDASTFIVSSDNLPKFIAWLKRLKKVEVQSNGTASDVSPS